MKTETKNVFLRTLFFLLVLVVLLGGLGTIKYRRIQNAMAMMNTSGPPPITVEVTTARLVNWQPHVIAVGTLTAREGVQVSAEVDGVIETMHFESGQKVNKGDILISLNDDSEQADLANQMVQLELAEKFYKRSESMWQRNAISENEFDEAESKVRLIRSDIASTKVKLAKKVIRAPFSGRLGIREVNSGEYVSPGDGLVSLQDSSILYADFSIPEKFLPDIHNGLTVKIRTSAYPDEIFYGKVSAIEAKVDESTRNIPIRASLNNEHGRLFPGMYADINLILDKPDSRIVVPTTSLVFSSFGDALFTVTRNEGGGLTVQHTLVSIGEQRDNLVAILSGLSVGEQVVSAGVSKLRNAAEVIISQDPRLQD